MCVQRLSSHSDKCDLSSRRRRIVIGVIAALLVVVALPICRGGFAAWARSMSARQMNVGAMSEAQRWLAWSARLDGSSGQTELMRAACFRRLGQMRRWENALASSRQKGAKSERVRQELMLGFIRQGAHDVPESGLRNSTEAGLLPYEVAAVSVRGHLARNEPEKAKKILESWAAAFPQEAHLAYLWGFYWYHQGDEAKALTEFETALARQPRHELALSARAKLLEKQDRLAEALKGYVNFATHCPRSDTAKVGLARVLRKLGRLDEARDVAESLASSPDRFSEVWAEMGSIELELGNYEEAKHWFAQAPVVLGEDRWEQLPGAATAFALHGDVIVASRVFAQVDVEKETAVRTYDLGVRLVLGPNKKEAAQELERLSAASATASTEGKLIEMEQARAAGRESTGMSAADLYALYCSACHGASGDGNGRPARHQFPRPRDFRTGNFRLVSTLNGNPTFEDVETVIRRGMPGTSMSSFENLSENQLQLLTREVLRLCRKGIRERYVDMLKEEAEEIDEQDVQEVVEVHTLPGEIVRVPSIGPADPDTVARGRDVYFECGCRSCHGDDGTGARDVFQFDEKRQPSPPRDLVNEPFKGGHEPESIYVRILVGMPGSPHPATRGLTQEQLIDLVHYCCGISREPKRTLTNHQRFLEATSRPLFSALEE